MQLEIAAMIIYLYAMYSMKNQKSEAAKIIKSVAAEEMLHAALIANLINAVGGRFSHSNPQLLTFDHD